MKNVLLPHWSFSSLYFLDVKLFFGIHFRRSTWSSVKPLSNTASHADNSLGYSCTLCCDLLFGVVICPWATGRRGPFRAEDTFKGTQRETTYATNTSRLLRSAARGWRRLTARALSATFNLDVCSCCIAAVLVGLAVESTNRFKHL
jgi:hypothetical protein